MSDHQCEWRLIAETQSRQIESLKRDISALREALAPFARVRGYIENTPDDHPLCVTYAYYGSTPDIVWGDIRAARVALGDEAKKPHRTTADAIKDYYAEAGIAPPSLETTGYEVPFGAVSDEISRDKP